VTTGAKNMFTVQEVPLYSVEEPSIAPKCLSQSQACISHS
jgi:hypothetical protein